MPTDHPSARAPAQPPLAKRPRAAENVLERPISPLAEGSMGLLISGLAVRLTRSASSYYSQHWGIGATEYRLVLALDRAGSSNAITLSSAADLDKAAASRALQALERQGYVALTRQGRETSVSLTQAGHTLAASLRQATVQREEALLQGLSAEQIASVRAALMHMIDNLAIREQTGGQATKPGRQTQHVDP